MSIIERRWMLQRGDERGRRASLYCAERLKAVPPVQGNVSRIGGFQIHCTLLPMRS
jgi:hypothetical protein